MTITYHIKISGRSHKFDTATALDKYIKKNKLSKKAVIILKDNGKTEIGKITVENYLNFDKLHS